jgi:hypothetical protein
MADILFHAHYLASADTTGKTGLTPTIDIHRVTRSSGAHSEVVTAGNMTETGDGLYHYLLSSADLTLYDYSAVAKTADATVTQKHVACLWTLWSISWGDIASTVWTIAGSIGKRLVDYVDAAISGRAVAGDAMTLANDAVSAAALATDAVTEITTANWSYASRTLTVSSTGATSTTTADLMTERRGDSWSITVTGLPDNSGYTSIWFTVKHRPGDTDAASVIQVKKNASGTGDGLLYVNGAAASDATKGSITVNSTTSITIALDESVTDDIIPGLYAYDIQTLIAGAVNTPSAGQFEVSADVTRSVV